jgi:biotin carboxylase
MVNKNLTRNFLANNKFNVPKFNCFQYINDAKDFFKSLNKSVIIKPVDSNGSKGVSKVEVYDNLDNAFSNAMKYSREKMVIIEEFLSRDGYQVAGDAFLHNGQILYFGFMNEHFDKHCNPFVPIGESYPSVMSDEIKLKAKSEIQRYMSLLGMKYGVVNMDFIIDKRGDIFIIEIGPRSGGNWISDAILNATGVDLAKMVVQSAIGETINFPKDIKEEFIASYVIHSHKDGLLNEIIYSESIKNDIISLAEFNYRYDKISRFENASLGIGAMLFKSKSIYEMLYRMDNMEEFIQVKLEE